MPEENKGLPQDLHLGNIAPAVCHKLGVPGCLVIVMHEDGTVGMSGHGINHAKANELLSVGIHLNLSQHDDMVRAGMAGQEAREIQQAIDANNIGSVQ